MKQLCEFYVKREEIEHNINAASQKNILSRNAMQNDNINYGSYYS